MNETKDWDNIQSQPFAFASIPPEAIEQGTERRDVAKHRQRILSTARTLFAEYGVDKVSMHQIARAAQVGQGTLYRRYAHKGLLCMALLNESLVHFQQEILAYLQQEEETVTVSALEQLNAVLVQLIGFNEANAPLLGAAVDGACGNRRTSPYQSSFYLWLRQIVMALLQHAIVREEIPHRDIEYTADLVLAPLAIDFYLYQRQELGFTQERIASGLQQFLFHGLNATREGDQGVTKQ
ncbi:MAG: TetR/AcrR family transcriptional regulator [Chloroflexota bacterium]|nr:TetR/AcrR family transcriptional regulator [Chloroflexota bacterium]